MAKSSAAVERKPKMEIVPSPALDATWDESEKGLPAGYSNQNQTLAISLARAELDQQITTARALPRSIEKAVRNITTLATLDEQSAKECIYALPRGGTPIKGPSIRLAEIIASQWGNCRVGSRVVHIDRVEKFVEAEGVFHDLETNAASTARVRRRISDKTGKVFSDDMILVTGNAVCSIAKRNAILGGVPKAVWRNAYDAVEKVIVGDVKTLTVRRKEAIAAFAQFGVTPEQICEALGVKAVSDIANDHIPTLVGMYQSLKSGEATVEEMFPKKEPAPARPDKKDFEKPAAEDKAETKADPVTGEIQDDSEAAEPGAPEAMEVGRQAYRDKRPCRVPAQWANGLDDVCAAAFKAGYDDEEAAATKKPKPQRQETAATEESGST